MNVLMVFPRYEYLEKVEASALNRFLSVCEKFVDSCGTGKHKLYFLAENDTARKLKEDLPYAKYITVTRDKDRDLLEICTTLADCFYTEAECVCTDYSITTVEKPIKSLDDFEKYYIENINKAYEVLIQNMQVVVEFSMAKKYMRFSLKEAPKGCIYYNFNVQSGEDKVYIAGAPNEELTKIWRGGIPSGA